MKLSNWRCGPQTGLIVLAVTFLAFTPEPQTAESQVAGKDAGLKELVLSSGKFSPGFSSGREAYSAWVAHRVDSVTVTLTPSDPHASLAVNGSAASSGQASPPIGLVAGRNIVRIEVTARDGQTKKNYAVKVIRAYPTPTWRQVQQNAPFLPRDSAGELVFRDRMWLFGGYTPKVIDDVWSSEDGTTWTKTGAIPNESGVNIPVNLVYDNKMWVVCNDGALYTSADGVDWTLVTDSAPWAGRYAAGGIVFADRMWVMGGRKASTLFNDVWSSTDGIDWTLETENAPWSKRQLFSMLAVHGGKMWVMGGGITTYHPFKAYSDVWSSPDGKTWSRVTESAPWPPRIWSTSVVYRNRLWILGGFRAEPTWNNFGDAWYSVDGADWNELVTETGWSPRHELSAYVHAEKLWVVAGNFWPLKNDVWCLDIPGLVFLSQPVVEEFVTARYTYKALADFNRSGEAVRYRLPDAPAWLTVDPETGLIEGTPDTVGDYAVTVEAYDTAGETARQAFTLHVVPVR